MRWGISFFAGVVLVGAAVCWMACIGEDPGASTALPGERGGPCNAGQCLSGLSCIDNVCVALDGSTTNEGGGNGEGGVNTDAGADAGDDGACPPLKFEANKISCIGSTAGKCSVPGNVCCRNASNNCEIPANCSLAKTHACETASQCQPDGGQLCCGRDTAQGNLAACPIKANFPGTECRSKTAGCGDGFEICMADDPHACGAGKVCRRAELGSTDPIVVGVCVPQ